MCLSLGYENEFICFFFNNSGLINIYVYLFTYMSFTNRFLATLEGFHREELRLFVELFL